MFDKKNMQKDFNRNNVILILVAALGYFVDIYDLVLFSVIRVKSLIGIGVPESELMEKGVFLLNMQMFGMLVGGILWGILGDKKGRLNVLFGSILLYSLANIANAFATNVEFYGIIRFIAGIGLAGELGVGITLVTESLSKENRGYGTMVVAGVGLLGAVVAALVGDKFDWQTSFLIGGGMGFLLLALRIGLMESEMFTKIKDTTVSKGNIFLLFKNKKIFFKYLNCIVIAIPVWFVVGILVTFAPEFGKAFGSLEPFSAGQGILYSYIGISLGDFTTGYLSQKFKSRKKIIFIFLSLTFILIFSYLFSSAVTPTVFYVFCGLLGFTTGFWAVFVTVAAEQFGTNIRSTVATTVPNFVRGSVVPLTLFFQYLTHYFGVINSSIIIAFILLLLSMLSLYNLEETYGKDLEYIEK